MAVYNTFNMNKIFEYNFKYNIHDSLNSNALYKAIKKYKKHIWVSSNGKRLEVLAYELYKNTDFWIILAIYNDIVNPFDVPNRVYFIPQEDLTSIINM
jgi:uncharacterized protein YvpB